ncbi:hypothetical protein ABPG74_022483 [Tetrahymena malaccensis]
MGNQCCAATNIPDQATATTTQHYQNEAQVENEEGVNQNLVKDVTTPAVHAQNAEAEAEIREQIEQNVVEQKNEDEENQREVSEYVFMRQLETLKQAISKAENLKDLANYGAVLTKAISQVELIIQLFSQTLQIPSYIKDFKTEVIGLYGDLQNFRAFHLRYTIEQDYYQCLTHISELTDFLKKVFNSQYKDGKFQFESIFQDLYKGDSHQAFEELKQRFYLVRDIYNRKSGQNFSTLPNYLYLIFADKKGFGLWNQLFPHQFEVSNTQFSEAYAEECSISTQQILKIISLLDNANDQRVDIYQWIGFVESYANHLDEDGKILQENIENFTKEVENKARAMKSAPVKNDDTWVFRSGLKYKGELDENNKRQGRGHLIDEDYEFEGNFLNDLPTDYGVETRKKVRYEGNFLNGLYHGQGTLTFPNGRQYTGSFEKHAFHGQGILTGDDGIKYEGEWKQGVLEYGKIVYHDGSYYGGKLIGSFFKDGNGKLFVLKPSLSNASAQAERFVEYISGTWDRDAPKNGSVGNLLQESVCYSGELANWSITGKGKRLYIDGSYEGELLRDKKTNQGTLTYKNGDKYVGKWLEDMQEKGTYYYSKEKDHYYEGEWKDGVMCGQGKFSYTSGGVYEGEVKDGKRHGKGKYRYANGNTYEGDWFENNQHGEGKFTYAVNNGEGGDIYQGQFQKGKFEGFGHYYYKKSGKQYIGFWQDDKWNGEGKFFSADGKIIKCGIWKNDKLETQKVETDIVVPKNHEHLILKIEHSVAAPAHN